MLAARAARGRTCGRQRVCPGAACQRMTRAEGQRCSHIGKANKIGVHALVFAGALACCSVLSCVLISPPNGHHAVPVPSSARHGVLLRHVCDSHCRKKLKCVHRSQCNSSRAMSCVVGSPRMSSFTSRTLMSRDSAWACASYVVVFADTPCNTH